MKKKIGWSLLIVLLIAQFFQPSKNNGTAFDKQDITHAVTTPPEVKNILQSACFDCHSNQTQYPWYSMITPINWWLKNHIDEGKRELNFSTFSSYDIKRQAKKMAETAEEVEEGHMPLDSYTWMHKEAKLTDGQKKLVADWARAASQSLNVRTKTQE
jgi:hypothetical protein